MGLMFAAYGAVCAAMYVMQDDLVFEPARAVVRTPRAVGLPFEDVTYHAADGVALHGWWVPGSADGAVVLLLHGKGGNVSHNLRTLKVLHGLGHGVFVIDYRGFGRSAGEPSEAGTYADAAAAFDYLAGSRGVPPARIVVYGRSLGGGIASWLAAARPAAGLILESTFTRLNDVGALRYPWLPVSLLSRFEYDSASRVGALRCPVLVAHGEADTTVPFRHGAALAAAAGPGTEFVRLPGDHQSAFVRGGPAYYARLDTFIRRAAQTGGTAAN